MTLPVEAPMAKRGVIVIGGGAAGLLAAGCAAGRGAETILVEKMDHPGCKLGISGNRRCNLTNAAPLPDFLSHFGSGGKFLRSAFSQFFTPDLVRLLAELGVRTVTEGDGRIFPASGRATDVVEALVAWVGRQGVVLRTRSRVEHLVFERRKVVGVKTGGAHGQVYRGEAVIVATGGASYPATGSTGDGYSLARSAGHTVVPTRPALVPLETAGDVASKLQGLSLSGVRVGLWIDGRKRTAARGEIMFTRSGVSGPTILSLSRGAVDALGAKQAVTIALDLKPDLDPRGLDSFLVGEAREHGRQQWGNVLKKLLPGALLPVSAELTGVSLTKPAHQVTAEERKRLRTWLKDFRLEVTGHGPFTEAMITAGGVDTREIGPRTMASRLVGGLYFAGEVLDIDADTGGYNLQAAFSTGWVAGRRAVG